MNSHPPAGPSPDQDASRLSWTEEGAPRSILYGDVFYSLQDGLSESREVFLKGCGLPEAWLKQPDFIVGELGFGTGLNILALLDLWERTRPPGGNLHIFSVEAHLLDAGEAGRALAAWPELSEWRDRLLRRWPSRARGFHRLEFPEANAVLDLAVMDVGDALKAWDGRANAWFLDGFSPALNPQMWSEEVLGLVAARSAPGARAATFTVAGTVRRGLAAAGFQVSKRPGFGRKRERLEALMSGRPTVRRKGLTAVIGAGVAGCAIARALHALGAEVEVFDPRGPGAGASGNPAALVTPRLDAGLGPVAALYAQALRRAGAVYSEDAIIARGVHQIGAGERDTRRFQVIAESDLYARGDMEAIPGPALAMHRAFVVEPRVALAGWLPQEVRHDHVASLTPSPAGWILNDPSGRPILEASRVIVAAGPSTSGLAPGLPLRPVRGQITWVSGPTTSPAAWGGYVAPTRDGLVFGATHSRGETDEAERLVDDVHNLELLARAFPQLASAISGRPLSSRASIRATTADHLPVAGALGDDRQGLFVLSGLGSRGFVLAPLLAEHVTALALGAPSPLPLELQAIVDPQRFARRLARRGGG